MYLRFREWFYLTENLFLEGANEDLALSILGNNQEDFNQIKNSLTGITPKYLPFIVYFYKQGANLSQLKNDFESFQNLETNRLVKPLQYTKSGILTQNQPIDYLKFTEILHAAEARQKNKIYSKAKKDVTFEGADPIFENDEVIIYEANSPQACVKYGIGYSFCISRPGNTMWQSYRDTQTSTFYFVFDKKRDRNDPLHVVVVDMTRRGPLLTDVNNTTGKISEFGKDANAYLMHLKSRNVPIDLFKNLEYSEQEKAEKEKLEKLNYDLNWFISLSPDEKSKYIGRGHKLGTNQFIYIWENKLDNLIQQYVTSGMSLNDFQAEKVLESKFRKSYLKQRLIAIQHTEDLTVQEFKALDESQKKEVILNLTDENIRDLIYHEENDDLIKTFIKYKKENLSEKNVSDFLHLADDKDEVAKIILKDKKDNLNERNINNLLYYTNNKDEIIKIILHYMQNKLTDEIINVLIYGAQNKQEIAKLIINYHKGNLNSENISDILIHSKNKKEIAHIIGKENINKLEGHNVFWLLYHAPDKEEMINILGPESFDKMTDSNIYDLLSYANDKDEMAKFIFKIKGNNLSDVMIQNLKEYAPKVYTAWKAGNL
jgi:hypothetical protein